MTALALPEPRSGLGYWLSSYRAMLRLDLTGSRDWLGALLIIQIMMGAGMAVIYGFYLGEMSVAAATFVATGAPTLAISPLGMAQLPALVSMH